MTPQQQVDKFLSLSTPTAQRLALLASGLPVTLPILNIVCAAFFPSANQSHVAEVLLSGLLYQVSPEQRYQSDAVLYEFHDGIREILQELTPLNEINDAIARISLYLEERAERERTIRAALNLPGNFAIGDIPEARVFAQIRANILRRLGYEELAKRLESSLAVDGAVDPPLSDIFPIQLPTERVPDVAPLPPGSRMPLGSNPLFTGRDNDLLQLAQALAVQRTSVVAAGIGGVGKTSLAAEFAHRYGQYFAGGVFWLNCAEADAIPAEIAACGGAGGLRLPDFDTLDFPAQVARVQAEWRLDTPRLLIFDNCEDPALVQDYLPTTGGCRVLITSRNPQWEETLGVEVQALGVLSLADSITLLRRFRPALTDADATAVAEAMGRLPLGLHLTGSFLRAYPRVTVADYLTQLDTVALDHSALQGRGAKDRPTDRAMHLARAFALSYDRLLADDAIDALALGLLARAARFAPGEPLARTLLLATLPIDEADDTARAHRMAAYRRLLSLGLLEQEADDTVRMHRLLCAYALPTAPDAGAQDAAEDAVIDATYAVLAAGYPAAMQPLLVHLQHMTERARIRTDDRAAMLFTNYASYLKAIGAYAQAAPLYERALAIREQVLGEWHPDTATSLNNLVELYQAQGAYDRAAPLLKRALAIREQVLRAGHPNTAANLNNLAELYRAQGAYDRAVPLYERALAIREQVLGDRHPDTAASLNNLAVLYQSQGAYDRAEPLHTRALDIYEQVLGAMHPDTATSLMGLAGLYQTQGAYDRALPLFERALAIREQVLGTQHPLTQSSQQSLAAIRQRLAPAQSDPVEALAPLLDAIAALAQGRTDIDRARVEEALEQLQQQGFLLRDPMQRIWQGERDTAALTAGLDATDTQLIAAVLARLEDT